MDSAKLALHVDSAKQIMCILDCPRALTVYLLLEAGQFTDVIDLVVNPDDYVDHKAFFGAYQATRLLQKSDWLPLGIDRRKVAMEKFRLAEASNALVNQTFEAVESGTASWLIPGFDSTIRAIRREIRSIVSKEDWLSALDKCGFGPGADLSTQGQRTSAYNKLSGPHSVTSPCTKFLDFYVQNSSLCQIFQWDIETRSLMCDRVLGNKVTLVPKNAKTDRVIAIEPRWNVYFQKGFGQMLRRCLKRSGCNLDDQTVNQVLAREGSLTNHYATIDLASASDSVSLGLVRNLLPAKLCSLLELSRSPYAFVEGKWLKNEKFSSMGNGYTFELESLIFLAVVRSICGDDVSVYGDDIIIPRSHYQEVVSSLYLLGFSTNIEKTFATGFFRESCGGDFFNGHLVTPIYWKDPLHVQGIIRLVNQVGLLAGRSSDLGLGHYRLLRFREQLVKRLPKAHQVKGPFTSSTSVGSHSSEWRSRQKYGWDGVFVNLMVDKALKFRYRDFTRAILSQFLQPSSDGYQIRGRTKLVWKEVFIPSSLITTNDEVYRHGSFGYGTVRGVTPL